MHPGLPWAYIDDGTQWLSISPHATVANDLFWSVKILCIFYLKPTAQHLMKGLHCSIASEGHLINMFPGTSDDNYDQERDNSRKCLMHGHDHRLSVCMHQANPQHS